MTNETSGHTVSDSRILRFAREPTRRREAKVRREEERSGVEANGVGRKMMIGASGLHRRFNEETKRRDRRLPRASSSGQNLGGGGGIVELGIGELEVLEL